MKKGILLINLGTPERPSTVAVRKYLREFLQDKRVLTIPSFLRYLLLYGVILPFRSPRTAQAYQEIWTPQGSPLLIHSLKLATKLNERLGPQYNAVLAMRYGEPSIKKALISLKSCETITVLPLYPQYSSAATGSSIEAVLRLLESETIFPSLNIIRDFHSHPNYIKALATSIRPYLASHDHLLLSYHGVPESHLKAGGCEQICEVKCPPTNLSDKGCYRAQCIQTSRLVGEALGLKEENLSFSFQSRLGRTPWIKPYTDVILPVLIAKGVKHLAIACPSFVVDCLETLEEIGMRAKDTWLKLGGETLTLIPCLNESDESIEALIAVLGIS
jgi:ferrochelatase